MDHVNAVWMHFQHEPPVCMLDKTNGKRHIYYITSASMSRLSRVVARRVMRNAWMALPRDTGWWAFPLRIQ